jgi:hypothetical protein
MTCDISQNKGILSYTSAKKRELVTNIIGFYSAHETHTHTHTRQHKALNPYWASIISLGSQWQPVWFIKPPSTIYIMLDGAFLNAVLKIVFLSICVLELNFRWAGLAYSV